MKTLQWSVLLVCACVGPLFGQESKAPATSPYVSDAVKQLEHDWADAMKAGDTGKLSQILAEDWAGLGYDGKKSTKQSYLADVKSGKSKLESFDFGSMDVKLLGNVVVVQGSDTEKSTTSGKDSSGKFVWMDVFVKRGDQWMAVRSQSAMVK